MNISTLFTGLKSVAGHPITKGGSVATIITVGLYTASAFGILIPMWAFTAGPALGYVAYRLLPKSVEDQIDQAAAKITEIATELPTIDPTYPGDDKKQTPSEQSWKKPV